MKSTLRNSPLQDRLSRALGARILLIFCTVAGLMLSPAVQAHPPGPQSAAESVDWDMVNRIRDEGFHRSQVMKTLTHLTEVIGPRLTGSPQMTESNEWTRQQLEDWGLENAHLEPFEFGRGWSFTHAALHLMEPQQVPLPAIPLAWTRGTEGEVRGELMQVELESEKDFEQYRGQLAGKILLFQEKERPRPPGRPALDEIPRRLGAEGFERLSEFPIPDDDAGSWRSRIHKRRQAQEKVREFLIEEKALATLHKSSRKNGILRVGGGGSREAGDPEPIPGLLISAENFQRLERLLDEDRTVELALRVDAQFHPAPEAFNTFAEIPGSGAEGEIVMTGAHLDSWHAGTGATDNAAGVAVMMEALRILQALEVKPKRTIRIALWSGEEQGLLGSRAYVEEHFASRPEAEEGENPFVDRWPLTLKPAHEKFSAYFNLDNGGGRVRGIYTQENLAVRPIFEAWLAPFADLGADTVVSRGTSGTDHQAFDRVGLPGFQMIQDPLDYFPKTHHTNLDVLDLVEPEDLKVSSVVLASLLYHAAMRDELLPRKPLPREPEPSEDEEDESEEEAAEESH